MFGSERSNLITWTSDILELGSPGTSSIGQLVQALHMIPTYFQKLDLGIQLLVLPKTKGLGYGGKTYCY